MLIVLAVLTLLAFSGLITALVAQARGFNAAGWFFLGCIFPGIAFLIVLALPSEDVAQARLASRPPTPRRTAPHSYHAEPPPLRARPVRDHASPLELPDQRAEELDMTEPAQPERAVTSGEPPANTSGTGTWYLMRGLKRVGPFNEEQILRMLGTGQIGESTVVWHPVQRAWFHPEELEVQA